MGDPLQGSGTSTPDAVSWDAVDEEISARAKFAAPLGLVEEEEDGDEGEDGAVRTAGGSDGFVDSIARRRVFMLACACLLSVGR